MHRIACLSCVCALHLSYTRFDQRSGTSRPCVALSDGVCALLNGARRIQLAPTNSCDILNRQQTRTPCHTHSQPVTATAVTCSCPPCRTVINACPDGRWLLPVREEMLVSDRGWDAASDPIRGPLMPVARKATQLARDIQAVSHSSKYLIGSRVSMFRFLSAARTGTSAGWRLVFP